MTDNAIASLRELIWDADKVPKTLQEIGKEIEQINVDRLDRNNILYTFSMNGFDQSNSLPYVVHFNFLMIYKEAIQNAIKYSSKAPIVIDIQQEKGTIGMRISNEIKELEEDKSLVQRGIANMQYRAEKAKGFFNYIVKESRLRFQFSLFIVSSVHTCEPKVK